MTDAETTIEYETGKDELTLHPYGRMDRRSVGPLWRNSKKRIGQASVKRISIDFDDVSGIDSSGVAYLRSVEVLCEKRGMSYEERNIPDNLREFLRYTRKHSSLHLEDEEKTSSRGFVASLGLKTIAILDQLFNTLDLFGRLLMTTAGRIFHPRQFHFLETLYQLQVVGVGAVPLIVALSLLLGMLMVFQGSSRSIGADILIADMVSIAVTREMAPLVVAVAIAARSGSAFAAEIGMMKVNQEIDALTVMNLDVISLIILPRVFAIALAEPILTMIADAVGIIGGLLTAKVHLGVPALMFLNEVRGILKAPDLFTGLLKAVTSGAITGFIGCASGLKAGTESRSVGSQTTAAVVKSIFAVILIDTLYSYIFLVYEW